MATKKVKQQSKGKEKIVSPKIPKEKFCKACKTTKPIEGFFNYKASPDGKYYICRLCHKKVVEKSRRKKALKAGKKDGN